MFAQLFESFRRATEATLQAQQDVFRQWVQQWPSVPVSSQGTTGEWSEAVQKRWLDSTKGLLNKQRELLDSTYRSGIDVIEQGFRVTDAKSPEEYRRLVEELWSKLSDSFKQQSESQFRDFQKAAERWFEVARQGSVAPADAAREYRDRESGRGYPESPSAQA
jgi:hypothetical protein